jgi:hypothetical protein
MGKSASDTETPADPDTAADNNAPGTETPADPDAKNSRTGEMSDSTINAVQAAAFFGLMLSANPAAAIEHSAMQADPTAAVEISQTQPPAEQVIEKVENPSPELPELPEGILEAADTMDTEKRDSEIAR